MLLFVDSHVHIHDCFPLDSFLDAACHNFKIAAAAKTTDSEWAAFLLLTESEGAHVFSRLGEIARSATGSENRWRFKTTDEDISIEAIGPGGNRLFLVPGGQIVTAERLEVLCIGSRSRFEDKMPIRETIDRVLEAGALPVLPWGPGKWFSERGKIVRDTIRYYGRELFLGDNGNRPGFWPSPRLFESASSDGHKILPGSDPLPFPSEAARAGSFGFFLDHQISMSHPARSLISELRNPESIPVPFGKLESSGRFFRNQIKMQLVKQGLIQA
jgi:hypothetical protein